MENAGSKNSAKEDEPPLSIPDLVGKAVAEGNSGLGALLNTGSTHYIYSGTAEGNQVARALNIPFSEGDAWSIGRVSQGSTDYYVLIYYSASQNGPFQAMPAPIQTGAGGPPAAADTNTPAPAVISAYRWTIMCMMPETASRMPGCGRPITQDLLTLPARPPWYMHRAVEKIIRSDNKKTALPGKHRFFAVNFQKW